MKHYLRFMITLILATVWSLGGYAQETATLKFTKACAGKGTDDKNGSWVISSDASESTFDKDRGIHYGTNSNDVSYLNATTSSYSNYTVTKIVVKASAVDKGNPKVNCTVGGQAFGKEQKLTTSNDAYTFEGKANGDIVVSISKSKSKKALYLLSVEITYESGQSGVATKLTFPQSSISFTTTDDLSSFTGQTATLTAGDETLTGKTITYKATGDDLFSSFNESTGALALNGNAGTATVTATFAGDDTYASTTASYTISVKSVISDIATLKSLITSTDTKNPQSFTLKLTDAVVTYVNKNTAYVQDATAGIYVYASGHNLENNQKINGLVDVKACLYNGLPEITTWTLASDAVVTENATFDVETVTLAELTTNYSKYESKPVKVAGAVVTKAFDDKNNGEISQDGTTYVVYNKGGKDVTIVAGDNIDIIGYPAIFNETKQLYLWKQSNVTVNYSQVATTLSFDPATTEYTVEKGKEKAFTAPTVTVTDANNKTVTDAKITYKSSNTEVATVAEDGTVSFVGFGTTTITASYAGDATHKAAEDISYTIIYGKVKTTMAWSEETVTANIGQNFTAPTLSLTANGESILEGKTITYESTEPSVAEISETGVVTIKGIEGTTTITANFAGDDTYAENVAQYTLTVVDPNKKEVTFNFSSMGYDNAQVVSSVEKDGVSIKFTKGGSNEPKYYESDKTLRVYKDGSITFTAPEGYNLSEITYYFTGGFTSPTEGNWVTPTWTGNAHDVTFTCTENSKIKTVTIKLVAAEKPEATSGTLEFKAVDDEIYYATFSSDKDIIFNKEDVYVAGVSVSNGKISLNDLTEDIYDVTDANGAVDGYYVPANTGVLVYGFVNSTTYYFPKDAQTVTLALSENQLKPALAEGIFTAEDGYKYYKLAYDNYTNKTGLGFYWGADNGGAFSVKAGTAYLAVPTAEANSAKSFAFNGGTTGIDNVNVDDNQTKVIYNLNGQRVESMSQAGLYIVNGKKVVVRK